ncbi:MAG: hypothetical protein M3Z20_18225 [Chloroflexota bacterium]|nr:hypothetical protein [Chloroflexota bacterium]
MNRRYLLSGLLGIGAVSLLPAQAQELIRDWQVYFYGMPYSDRDAFETWIAGAPFRAMEWFGAVTNSETNEQVVAVAVLKVEEAEAYAENEPGYTELLLIKSIDGVTESRAKKLLQSTFDTQSTSWFGGGPESRQGRDRPKEQSGWIDILTGQGISPYSSDYRDVHEHSLLLGGETLDYMYAIPTYRGCPVCNRYYSRTMVCLVGGNTFCCCDRS